MNDTRRRTFRGRQLIGILLLAAVAATSARVTRAMEIIPSVGITKSTDDNAGNATGFGGLALRFPLLGFLKLEGGVGYRQDSFSDGDVKVRQWPLTASLWLAPAPMLYAGGGLGWYKTTTDYRNNLVLKDTTTQTMGVHVGGGVDVPLGPKLALDLSGRYIFMQADNSPQLPTSFNPDFWTLALGLAIKF